MEKLSRQVLVMEKLAAVSDENLGNITSVVEGKPATCRPCLEPKFARRAHAHWKAAKPLRTLEPPLWSQGHTGFLFWFGFLFFLSKADKTHSQK